MTSPQRPCGHSKQASPHPCQPRLSSRMRPCHSSPSSFWLGQFCCLFCGCQQTQTSFSKCCWLARGGRGGEAARDTAFPVQHPPCEDKEPKDKEQEQPSAGSFQARTRLGSPEHGWLKKSCPIPPLTGPTLRAQVHLHLATRSPEHMTRLRRRLRKRPGNLLRKAKKHLSRAEGKSTTAKVHHKWIKCMCVEALAGVTDTASERKCILSM